VSDWCSTAAAVSGNDLGFGDSGENEILHADNVLKKQQSNVVFTER